MHLFSIKTVVIMVAATIPLCAAAGPIGYGAAATGGGKYSVANVGDTSSVVSASSMSAIQAAIDAYSGSGGLVIKYTGKFDYSSITDVCSQHAKSPQTVTIKDKSDITIVGANGSSANFGFRLARANNIVIRNMKMGLLPGGDNNGDAIGIDGASTNIWIDHNELFSSNKDCPGTGDTMYDGLFDIKEGANNITFSYNYVHDHHKVGLDGSSDKDVSTDRHITFHHNWYENVSSRLPLQRGGHTHIFNNYYNKITVSGINVRVGGYSLIESNYFEDTTNPVTSRDSKVIGYWDLRNNYQTGTVWSSQDSATVNATNWTTTKTFPESVGYFYAPDSAALVKCIVKATAGVNSNLAETAPDCTGGGSTSGGSTSGGSTSGGSTSGGSTSGGSSTTPTLSGTNSYPDGFSKCADEGEKCNVNSGSGWVAFGRKGSWVTKYVGAGKSIMCTVSTFGSDPKGSPNKCSYQK